jgi:hypothetical protein
VELIKPFQVGDHVEVTGGERLFAGVITSVIHESEFQVKYYEYDSEVVLPRSCLQRITRGPFQTEDVKLGMKCQCKYAVDQQYYDAVISGITQFGYTVTYIEYGNSEEVPLEYLRPSLLLKRDLSHIESGNDKDYEMTSSSSAYGGNGGGTGEKKGNLGRKDQNGLIPIPEALKILPTDTEEVS